MTLYQSTYLFAAILFVCGIFFIFPKFKPLVTAFPRSKTAAVVTFGGGGLWFLYILSTLGEADFGDIKIYLIAIFGVAGLLAFKYLDDFLSVRGLAISGSSCRANFSIPPSCKNPFRGSRSCRFHT